MNKNLFKSLAFAAVAVIAGACAKEQIASGDGETVEMTFNVDVPEATITTKGLSDAAQVDELIFQLFIKDGDNYKMVQNQIVPVTDKRAVVKASLVKQQHYDAAFWAQTSGTGFYETTDLRAVKMNTANVKANEPKMDAFWMNDSFTATVARTKPIKMLRALAQVNIGTVVPTGEDALSIAQSQIVMKGVPTTLNVLLGNKNNSHSGSEDITFQDNAPIIGEKLTVGEAAYDYVATAYVFAPKDDKMLTDIATKVTFSNGKYTTITTPNVPIRRNFRTNILGNLFNVDATWNVNIDEKFTGDITYDEIEGKLLAGKNVTLTTDYSVAKNSKGVVAKSVDNTFAVLDLNGHKFENSNSVMDNKAALQVHGNLRIVGDGKVLCNGGGDNNAVIVENGAHLIIEGGYYYVNKDKNSKSNATIFISSNGYPGKKSLVEIEGGTFEAEVGTNGTPFVLNQDDAVKETCFKVYGGTFIGFNPADNNADGEHTNYVADGYRSVKISDSPETWKVEAIPAVTTQEAFESAITTANATVVLAAGTYDMPSTVGDGVSIIGTDASTSVLTLNSAVAWHGVNATLKNITVKYPNANYIGIQHAESIKYIGCIIEGQPFSYANNAVFEKCTFNQTSSGAYNIWTYGSKEITFNNCVFNCAGKSVLIYNEGALPTGIVTLNKCKFIASQSVTGKAAIEIDSRFSSYEVYINDCTHEGFANGSVSGNSLWNKKDGDKSVKVVVDGTQVL